MICSHKCVSIAGTKDHAEIMVGEMKRRSNTEKKDVAFFEGSDFHHVQAHLHLDNFTEYNVVTKKGRALISLERSVPQC